MGAGSRALPPPPQGGEDTPFPSWAPLLSECEDYAALMGWRFVLADFMRVGDSGGEPGVHAARAAALPTALDYGDRVRNLAAADPDAQAQSTLFAELRICQRLVDAEAVLNSMTATCRALGLFNEGKSGVDGALDDSIAFQDTSQPLPVIARRLQNYERHLQAEETVRVQRRDRLLHASFIVDFAAEHGLHGDRDPTCEGARPPVRPHMRAPPLSSHPPPPCAPPDQRTAAMLNDFLDRVKEWGGDDPSSRDLVRSLVVDALEAGSRGARGAGRGRGPGHLVKSALDWFEANKTTAVVGGAVLAGAVGLFVAGAAILAAGARGGGPRPR